MIAPAVPEPIAVVAVLRAEYRKRDFAGVMLGSRFIRLMRSTRTRSRRPKRRRPSTCRALDSVQGGCEKALLRRPPLLEILKNQTTARFVA